MLWPLFLVLFYFLYYVLSSFFSLILWFLSLPSFVIPSRCLKNFISAASKSRSSLFFSTQAYEDNKDNNQSIIDNNYCLPRILVYHLKDELGWLNEVRWDAHATHKEQNETWKEFSTRSASQQVTSVRRQKTKAYHMQMHTDLRTWKWSFGFHTREPSVDKLRNYRSLNKDTSLWICIVSLISSVPKSYFATNLLQFTQWSHPSVTNKLSNHWVVDLFCYLYIYCSQITHLQQKEWSPQPRYWMWLWYPSSGRQPAQSTVSANWPHL